MALTSDQLKSLVVPVEEVKIGKDRDGNEMSVWTRGLTVKEVERVQSEKETMASNMLRLGLCDENGVRLIGEDDEFDPFSLPSIYMDEVFPVIGRLSGMKMAGDKVDPSALAEKK